MTDQERTEITNVRTTIDKADIPLLIKVVKWDAVHEESKTNDNKASLVCRLAAFHTAFTGPVPDEINTALNGDPDAKPGTPDHLGVVGMLESVNDQIAQAEEVKIMLAGIDGMAGANFPATVIKGAKTALIKTAEVKNISAVRSMVKGLPDLIESREALQTRESALRAHNSAQALKALKVGRKRATGSGKPFTIGWYYARSMWGYVKEVNGQKRGALCRVDDLTGEACTVSPTFITGSRQSMNVASRTWGSDDMGEVFPAWANTGKNVFPEGLDNHTAGTPINCGSSARHVLDKKAEEVPVFVQKALQGAFTS